jgi:hypothetical protein
VFAARGQSGLRGQLVKPTKKAAGFLEPAVVHLLLFEHAPQFREHCPKSDTN